MLLKNYYNALATRAAASSGIPFVTMEGSIEKYSQNAVADDDYMDLGYASLYQSLTNSRNWGDVICGDGSTPVTKTDYKLSGDIIQNLTQLALSSSFNVSEEGVEITRSYVARNDGASNVTIREVGWRVVCRNSNVVQKDVLFERSVLPSPITLIPGGTGVIKYTMKFPYGV